MPYFKVCSPQYESIQAMNGWGRKVGHHFNDYEIGV